MAFKRKYNELIKEKLDLYNETAAETDPVFSAWLIATPPLYPGSWYDAVQNTIALSGFNNDLTYEVPLTFSTGLTRTVNTITCDITQYTDSDAISAIQGDPSWNATDWNTAYGWGNHASAGYLTSATAATTYLKLDCSNDPLTGNLEISKANAEYRATDETGEYARILRVSTNNQMNLYNRTLSVGTAGYYVTANANTDYILLPYNVANAVGTSDFSISVMVKINTLGLGVTQQIINQRDNASPFVGWFLTLSTTDKISLSIDKGVSIVSLTSTNAITDNDLHHILFTIDRNGNAACYIDEVANGTADFSSTDGIDLNTGDGIHFFDWNAGSGVGILGGVDEFAMFNKVLDATEISREANGGSGYYHLGTENGLIALMHFDENTGTTTREEVSATNANLNSIDWTAGGVSITGAMHETIPITSRDGVTAGEYAIHTFGDVNSRAVIEGLTTRFNIAGVEQINLTDGVLAGTTDNDIDLGSSTKEFKDLYIDGIVYADTIKQADSEKHYFGTGDDAYIEFDADSLNIKADAVNATDKINLLSDTIFVGSGVGLPYGSCWGNEIGWSQSTAAQNTWYVISDTDMSDGQLNLVTHDGSGKLTVTVAGRYLVNYSWSGDCDGVGEHIQLGIAVSGTVGNDGINHFYTATASEQYSVSGTAILNLAANAYVEVAIRTTDTGTPTLETDHLNITLTHIGG